MGTSRPTQPMSGMFRSRPSRVRSRPFAGGEAEALELEAERDGVDAVSGREALFFDLLGDCRAHGDDGVGHPGQRPLDERIDRCGVAFESSP